nr:hypothetical protein BaRGS_028163 [Batillaria attramentaria]
MRKEEAARCNMLNEQLKVTQAELKRHRDLLNELGGKAGTGEGANVIAAANASELEELRREKDSQAKEMLILRRTVDELEIRIETQKQTLAARDASIKMLLDMMQLEDDRREVESLQAQAAHDATKIRQLEAAVETKDAEILRLTEELNQRKGSTGGLSLDLQQAPANSHTLNAMLEAKDARISALENEVQLLEDKLLKSKEDLAVGGLLSGESSGIKDKLLRSEVQSLREEVGQKERELASLQLQAETLKRQHQETLHHVTVVKEQLAARDKQVTMLQADIEGLQERLKNKDGTIERKNKESQNVASEKRRLESEVHELKDQIDTKDRKITVLQRKVETQEDLMKEKEEQLAAAKSRLTFTDSTDSAVSSLEESITEKDRQIERLREMREQADKDHQEELDLYIKTNQDLKTQMEAMHFELTAKQTELCELREEAAELRAHKFKADTKMRQLEATTLEHKNRLNKEMVSAEVQTDEVPAETLPALKAEPAPSSETTAADKGDSEGTTEDLTTMEGLQKKVAELELDRKEKESQIAEMQDFHSMYPRQLTVIQQKNERIEELEEALRESVRITAQREMDMAELQAQIDASKTAMEEMRKEVEAMQASSRDYSSKLATLTRQLEDRDAKLRRMNTERQKHLEEVYEMKQEAVQAAISEKDATIALLEMTMTVFLFVDLVVRVIRKLEHSKKRLRTLVEKLETVCNDTDPSLLEGITAPVQGPPIDFANLRSLSLEQLLLEALRSEDECRSLQGQANYLLQKLGTRAPELLQAFLAILDSSDTDSCTSCQSN